MNRRAAALRRSSGGYRAPADRPSQRRCAERAGAPAVARGIMHGIEVREEPDEQGAVGFRAYASVTESPYEMWDMFGPYTETIAATAFDETLAAQPDVAYLLNHGGMTLARTTSGTLQIGVDESGLWYEPRLDPQNSVVRDVLSGIRRGDLNESSFAFRIQRGSWDPGYTAYRIEQLDLHRGDVSTVNYGANPATGDHPVTLGFAVAELDDDALAAELDLIDDQQALALTTALEQRHARLAARDRDTARRAPAPGGSMSRTEIDALRSLAAPHPLAGRVQN